jgi:K(+)-stimulated pyrophosphate-energized sodium pump
VAAIGIVSSLLGTATFFMGGRSPDARLAVGVRLALVVAVGGVGLSAALTFAGEPSAWLGPWLAVVAGMVASWGVSELAGRSTSDRSRTVKEVARQSQDGAAALIIAGVAEGLRSSVVSAAIILGGVGAAFYLGDWGLGAGGGFYGVGLAAIGASLTIGARMAVQAFGSITDSAAALSNVAGMAAGPRSAVAELNASGDATKAVSRGSAIASAVLTGLALYAAFTSSVGSPALDVGRPAVAAGLVVGAMVPFLVAALTLRAVARTRKRVVDTEGHDMVSGEADPPQPVDVVRIAARASLTESAASTGLMLVIPVVAWFLDVELLGGLVAGAVVTGFLLAVFAANAGGALATTRKFLESGAFGGAGGKAHSAALVGDSFGDPFKDAVAPALGMAMKLPALVALALALGILG